MPKTAKNETSLPLARPTIPDAQKIASEYGIDIPALLAKYAARREKRKVVQYVPRSDAARAKCVHVHSYIVGEHWRRRPNRS